MKILDNLRIKILKIRLVMPIIGVQFGVVAKIDGGIEELPEVIKVDMKGK